MKRNANHNRLWEKNKVQFPRLLAEIRAVGLTQKQYADLCSSMNLEKDDVDALFERAEQEWELVKEVLS